MLEVALSSRGNLMPQFTLDCKAMNVYVIRLTGMLMWTSQITLLLMTISSSVVEFNSSSV